MTELYLQRPADFSQYGLPQLPGDPSFQLLYAERFDVLPNEESLTKPRAAYVSATAWPDGWETWDPSEFAMQADYCDAELRSGIIELNGSTSDEKIVAGKLRAFPTYETNYWRVFARIGMGPSANAPLEAGEDAVSGLLISGADLLGAAAATGPFHLAGSDGGSAAQSSIWTDFATRASLQALGVLSSQLIIQLEMSYDGVENLTRITPMYSDDGKGFTRQRPVPEFGEYVWAFSGRPSCIGLAGFCLNTSSAPGPAWNARWSARLDSLSIYGCTTSPSGETHAQGGKR